MNVETAELESHLSKYLQQVRSTGESITVCQGSEPVAILAPLVSMVKNTGTNLIDRLLASPWPVKEFIPFTRSELYERE